MSEVGGTEPAAASALLRPMRVRDLEPVLAIEAILFADDPPWSEGQFRDELDEVPMTRHYVIAETLDSQVVGYAGARYGLDDAEILTMAVASHAQRLGIGRLLLGELLQEALDRQLGAVFLEVRADNQPAIELYRSSGFATIATRKRYYADGRDALVMKLPLR